MHLLPGFFFVVLVVLRTAFGFPPVDCFVIFAGATEVPVLALDTLCAFRSSVKLPRIRTVLLTSATPRNSMTTLAAVNCARKYPNLLLL